jgi:hypothetical protein
MRTLPIGVYARSASRMQETAGNEELLRSKADGWHLTKYPVSTGPLVCDKIDRKTELWTI